MSEFFLSCDWGTTHLRIQCVERQSGAIAVELQTAEGAARLAAEATGDARAGLYCRTLGQRIAELELQAGRPLSHLPILISGMASSSLGWQELPYAELPFRLDGSGVVWRELQTPVGSDWPQHRGRVILVSGVRSACDVLRGEETQVLGLGELARLEPERFELPDEAIVLLPGTHSKHIVLSAGGMLDFHTFMTGELYAVLGTHSVLRHTVELTPEPAVAAGSPEAAIANSAFSAGVERGAAAGLSAGLFSVRTRQLLQGHSRPENAAFLSGLLIGDELAYLLAGPAANLPIVLAAAGPLAAAYAGALQILGAKDRCTPLGADDVRRLTALGHSLLLRHIHRNS